MRLPVLLAVGSVGSVAFLWWNYPFNPELANETISCPLILHRQGIRTSSSALPSLLKIYQHQAADALSSKKGPNLGKSNPEAFPQAAAIRIPEPSGHPTAFALPPPPRLQSYPTPGSSQTPGSALNQEATAGYGIPLDVSIGAVLPAILAAPSESNPTSATAPASEAAARILREFVSEVSTAELMAKEKPEGSKEETLSPGMETQWQTSTRRSDEQFRGIFGKEAFLSQSLQAARVLREAVVTP